MNIHIIFSFLALAVYVFGALHYVKDILKGNAIPHPFTWLGGGVMVGINLYSLMLANGFSWSAIPIVIRLLNLTFGTIMGFIYIRKIKVNVFDILCLVLSLLCIVMLHYMELKNVVVFTIVIDILLLLPTIKKILINPFSDTALVRITTSIMPIFFLLGVEVYTFEILLYWIAVIFQNLGIAFLIIYKKKTLV